MPSPSSALSPPPRSPCRRIQRPPPEPPLLPWPSPLQAAGGTTTWAALWTGPHATCALPVASWRRQRTWRSCWMGRRCWRRWVPLQRCRKARRPPPPAHPASFFLPPPHAAVRRCLRPLSWRSPPALSTCCILLPPVLLCPCAVAGFLVGCGLHGSCAVFLDQKAVERPS